MIMMQIFKLNFRIFLLYNQLKERPGEKRRAYG